MTAHKIEYPELRSNKTYTCSKSTSIEHSNCCLHNQTFGTWITEAHSKETTSIWHIQTFNLRHALAIGYATSHLPYYTTKHMIRLPCQQVHQKARSGRVRSKGWSHHMTCYHSDLLEASHDHTYQLHVSNKCASS